MTWAQHTDNDYDNDDDSGFRMSKENKYRYAVTLSLLVVILFVCPQAAWVREWERDNETSIVPLLSTCITANQES